MTISGTTDFLASGGIFSLENWLIVAKPETNVTMYAWNGDAIDLEKIEKSNYNAYNN